MRSNHPGIAADQLRPGMVPELKDVVLGLHWDPPPEGAAGPADNLDAMCVLIDADQRVLEVIHPDHPRSRDGSVVHTGDGKTGASVWDDERIFVFLDALPANVATLAFIVASATGRTFGEVPGAHSHVSDHATEHQWVKVDLTALGDRTVHCVAALRRDGTGWQISDDGDGVPGARLPELLKLASRARDRGAEP
jgi:tellurium resistance protein TerZ